MKKRMFLIMLPLIFAGWLGAANTGNNNGGDAGSGLLVAEIEKARSELMKQKITQKEKHDAYMRLGRLLQLSGDIEGAANAWMRAAYAEEGKRDDTALLDGAACYMAMGELDKAEANTQLVLITVRNDKNIFLKAKYLAAQIEAFRNGDDVILQSLADDPEYKSSRPALYWTLWKLSGDARYKAVLLNEYPESPETRALLAESSGKNYVSEASSPQWLLFTGKPPSLENVLQAPDAAPSSGMPPALQTGVFNSQDNALLQAKRLKDAGFNAGVARRQTGDAEYWAVTVPAGSNLNKTITALKNAGFDAFPVY